MAIPKKTGASMHEFNKAKIDSLSDIQLIAAAEIIEGATVGDVCPTCHPERYAFWMNKGGQERLCVPC